MHTVKGWLTGDKGKGATVEVSCEDVAKAGLSSSIVDIMEVRLQVRLMAQECRMRSFGLLQRRN